MESIPETGHKTMEQVQRRTKNDLEIQGFEL